MTNLSVEHEANVELSCQSTSRTDPLWTLCSWRSWPVCVSQSAIEPSRYPLSNSVPLWFQRMATMGTWRASLRTNLSSPAAVHTRISPLNEAEASKVPCAFQTTDVTATRASPGKGSCLSTTEYSSSLLGRETSQIRAVPSPAPVASTLLLAGFQAQKKTGDEWPRSICAR
ncbi:hypothetical protein GGF41_002805, partial [Coemansia sp. RSA 2531]